MAVRELKLTDEQHSWVNNWLELWGAWVYSGRLEKRQSSVIAQWMSSVEPQSYPYRPMCNDDDGLLISQVVDSVMSIDKKAFGILLSYYAHGSTEHAIASYYHRVASPRKLATRGGNRMKIPSMSTCRREVKEILSASQYIIYMPLLKAMNERVKVNKVRKVA
ncbi:antiterminator Q family protein [Pantoea eucrina]|uniref:antiterminator Q family protein n=1 Tax=Pantoea eucrina TaxID=472693 RepID=UPI0024B77E45|nr:antiterminator Q family protein [Pantoea eucrina]MDJ0023094.1 antiterminator Q family protein [Pantoea eucrina]